MIKLRLCYNTSMFDGFADLYDDNELGLKLIYNRLVQHKNIFGEIPAIYTLSEQVRINGYISGGDTRFSPKYNCWVRYNWSVSKEMVDDVPEKIEQPLRDQIIEKLVADYRKHLEEIL